MSTFTLHRITAKSAAAEPDADRLFGPSYDTRQAQLAAAHKARAAEYQPLMRQKYPDMVLDKHLVRVYDVHIS